MNPKNVLRKRLAILLVVMFLSLTLLGGTIFALFRNNAEDGTMAPTSTIKPAQTKAAPKYTANSVTIGENSDWIFTTSTPEDMVYRMIVVTVKYDVTDGGDEERALELTGKKEGNAYVAVTGELVEITFSSNSSTKKVSISVTVTPQGDEYDSSPVSTENPKEFDLHDTSERSVIGITATYEPSDDVFTYTQIGDVLRDNVTVRELFNDGSPNSGTVSVTSSDNLFPSKFEDVENGLADNALYNKVITVTSTEGSTLGKDTTVEITNIKFAYPSRISISGNFEHIQARSKLEDLKTDTYLKK